MLVFVFSSSVSSLGVAPPMVYLIHVNWRPVLFLWQAVHSGYWSRAGVSKPYSGQCATSCQSPSRKGQDHVLHIKVHVNEGEIMYVCLWWPEGNKEPFMRGSIPEGLLLVTDSMESACAVHVLLYCFDVQAKGN